MWNLKKVIQQHRTGLLLAAGFIFWMYSSALPVTAKNVFINVEGQVGQSLYWKKGVANPVWTGQRLSTAEPITIRVDADARLMVQYGPEFPDGSLIEFSEFAFIGISDTEFRFYMGKGSIMAGITQENVPDIITSYGTLVPHPKSIGHFMLEDKHFVYRTLLGNAQYVPPTGSKGHVTNNIGDVPVNTGQELVASAAGRYIVRDMQTNIHTSLINTKFLRTQYFASDPISPILVRVVSPLPEFRTSSDAYRVTGIVNKTEGSVSVTVDGNPVKVRSNGAFTIRHPITFTDNGFIDVRFERGRDTSQMLIYGIRDTKPPLFELADIPEPVEPEIVLHGRINEPGLVMINNHPLNRKNAWFKKKVPLKAGKNVIGLSAIDMASNRSDITVKVDYEPPAADKDNKISERNIEIKRESEKEYKVEMEQVFYRRGAHVYYRISDKDGKNENGSYTVYRSASKQGPYIKIGDSPDTHFVDESQPDAGLIYYYRAAAIDKFGREGPRSEPIKFDPGFIPVHPPENITVTLNSEQVRVMWTAYDDPRISGYNIYKTENKRTTRIGSVDWPPYFETIDITEAAQIEYQVTTLTRFPRSESDMSTAASIDIVPKKTSKNKPRRSKRKSR